MNRNRLIAMAMLLLPGVLALAVRTSESGSGVTPLFCSINMRPVTGLQFIPTHPNEFPMRCSVLITSSGRSEILGGAQVDLYRGQEKQAVATGDYRTDLDVHLSLDGSQADVVVSFYRNGVLLLHQESHFGLGPRL